VLVCSQIVMDHLPDLLGVIALKRLLGLQYLLDGLDRLALGRRPHGADSLAGQARAASPAARSAEMTAAWTQSGVPASR
jgi:hypothetical protein